MLAPTLLHPPWAGPQLLQGPLCAAWQEQSSQSCDSSCLLPLKCFHCNACVLNDRRDGSCFRGHASGQQPPSLLLHVNSEDGEAFPAAGGS